jgi:hypothetical protein
MKTTGRKLSETQIYDLIEQGYGRLDVARTGALQGLLRLREAKASALQRELETARRAGDRESIRLFASLAEDGTRVISSLKREATISSTPVPPRKKDAAVVHGYVWREKEGQLEPAGKTTVAVFEGRGEELGRKLMAAKTNNRGYFKMAVPIKASDVKLEAAGGAGATAPRGSVVVFGSKGKEAGVSKTVPLASESLSFRELVLMEERKRPGRARRTKRKDQRR